MNYTPLKTKLVALGGLLAALCQPVQANPLESLCSMVDCLTNFTAKQGYTFTKGFSEGEWVSGGYTDLKQSWYISPGPGFEKATFNASESAFFDVNIIIKGGKYLSDKVAYIHDLAASSIFSQGLLKYGTMGYSLTYVAGTGERWRHGPWAGFTVKF
jgi:hypothetical protein